MKQPRCIGSCLSLFVMAIVFDIIGVILLFVGIFGDVRLRGVFYGDFLIYTGALVMFASLAWWLMWYTGNIRVEDEGLERKPSAAHSVKQLARKLTERLSRKPPTTGEKTGSNTSTVRNVTWGKSTYFPGLKDQDLDMVKCNELPKLKSNDGQFTCYQNQGYEDEESAVNKEFESIQEETDDKKHSHTLESDASKDTSQDNKPEDQFTCYQNEGYEDSESGVIKPQENKADDLLESLSIDELL